MEREGKAACREGARRQNFRTTSAIFILFLSFLPPTTFHCTRIVQNVYGSGQLTSETDLLCLTEYFCSRRWLPVSGSHCAALSGSERAKEHLVLWQSKAGHWGPCGSSAVHRKAQRGLWRWFFDTSVLPR